MKEFPGHQRFEDFQKLEERLSEQGEESRSRISKLRGRQPVEIPMPYRIALLGAKRTVC